MPTPLKVLLLEDRESDAKLMAEALQQAGFEPQVRWVDNETDFVMALKTPFDLVPG